MAHSPPHIHSNSLLARSFFSSPGLLLAVGLLVISPLLEGGTTHVAVMVIRLMILLLLGMHLASGIRAGALTWPRLRIGRVVLVYLGLAVFSTLLSPYTNQSLQWVLVLLSYAGLLYLLVSLITEWDHMVRLLAVLVAMGSFEAGVAMLQGGWLGAPRPSGTFFNPNFLAGYLAAVWAIVLGYVCHVKAGGLLREERGRGRWRPSLRLAVAIVLLTVLLAGIVWTGSRGGALAWLVGTGVVVVARFGRKGASILLLLVLIGLLVASPLRDRFRAEHAENPVGYARWQIWQSSVRQMIAHPMGVGLGLYQYVYPRYAFPVEGQIVRYGNVAQTAHDEYLQMGVELGIASILVFAWGVYLVGAEAVSLLRQRLRRWQRGVAVGLAAAVMGILVHAAVDSNLHEPALVIVLTLSVGLIFSMRRLAMGHPEPLRTIPVRSRRRWAWCGALLVGLLVIHVVRVGVAWVAYDAGARTVDRQEVNKKIGYYRAAIVLDPGKALYHSSIAASYFQVFEQTGNIPAARAAVAELKEAMALNPLDGRLAGLLGNLYVSLSSSPVPAPDGPSEPADHRRTSWLRLARPAYEQAVELEPFSAFHRYDLGRVAYALQDREAAESSVRRAVELEPNFLPGREWLARLYLRSNRLDVAQQEYREILERQRRYGAWSKNAFEQRFFNVDVIALGAAFERAGAGT
jgi:hypothetical protein